jgi:hypothetical protein
MILMKHLNTYLSCPLKHESFLQNNRTNVDTSGGGVISLSWLAKNQPLQVAAFNGSSNDF